MLRLLWHVRLPDRHVLTEPDVGPENAESEQPLPHDVTMLAPDHVLEITGALECGDHEDEKRHRTAGRARENVDAEHGREPAVVQTHQPVERAKGQTEREERKAREGDFAKSNRELRIAVLILPNRKSPE